MTAPIPQPQPVSTDATFCKMCGGPFSSKRIIIQGEQYHERCAIMSYPSHTHEDYARLSEEHASLKAKVEELEARVIALEQVISEEMYPENCDDDASRMLLESAIDSHDRRIKARAGLQPKGAA